MIRVIIHSYIIIIIIVIMIIIIIHIIIIIIHSGRAEACDEALEDRWRSAAPSGWRGGCGV